MAVDDRPQVPAPHTPSRTSFLQKWREASYSLEQAQDPCKLESKEQMVCTYQLSCPFCTINWASGTHHSPFNSQHQNQTSQWCPFRSGHARQLLHNLRTVSLFRMR